MRIILTNTLLALSLSLYGQVFTKVTNGSIEASTPTAGYSGASWIDYDSDGDLDLFVNKDFLYQNDGTGNFTTVVDSGIEGWDSGLNNGNSWADIDNDGDLDLVLVNQGNNGVYLNNGDETFTSVTPAFVTPDVESTGVVSWIDYDHDGDQDLFMIKSGRSHPDNGEENRMYHNLLMETGNLEFERVYTAEMVNHFDLDFQASWGDYDNDGDMDVYLGNFDDSNYLYRNEGDSLFTQVNSGTPVTNNTATLGSAWGDFDNDGDLDLYVANTNGQTCKYYKNDGSGNFTSAGPVEIGAPVSNITAVQGCANADYNNDGYLDLIVTNSFFSGGNNASNLLYENNGGTNNYLELTCKGTISNAAAIGTKIWIKATINGNPVWQLRHITGSPTGNTSQNDLRVHFGLADAGIVDSLVIDWPLGLKETYTDVLINQILEFVEGEITEALEPRVEDMALKISPNPSTGETQISYRLKKSDQKIQLRIVDNAQKVMAVLFNGVQQRGLHELKLNTADWPAGAYYLILEKGTTSVSKAMIVVKH